MRRTPTMTTGRPRFLLNRNIPAVAGPVEPFGPPEGLKKPGIQPTKVEKPALAEIAPQKPQGSAQATPDPGAMAGIDLTIQKESEELATRARDNMGDRSMGPTFIRVNMSFIEKLREKHKEARDTIKNPDLAEKYQDLIDDHMAMNRTLESVTGAGQIEKSFMT